ncbi:hypothetical protein ALP25_200118 [Pseudomonas syringae pv. syringae]|nr:hypothetical protein ALP25_200118 [Pseudomonas syringae pv. syringae]
MRRKTLKGHGEFAGTCCAPGLFHLTAMSSQPEQNPFSLGTLRAGTAENGNQRTALQVMHIRHGHTGQVGQHAVSRRRAVQVPGQVAQGANRMGGGKP